MVILQDFHYSSALFGVGNTMCLGAGLSNEKGPWLFVRYMMGMKSYPVISGDFFINHEINIPIKQPVCDLGQFCWARTVRATKLVMSLLS